MADSPYSEDIVKNLQGHLGLVLQDAEETSDESDSDDEVLKKGQIVVCWYPSGHEETINITKVRTCSKIMFTILNLQFSENTRNIVHRSKVYLQKTSFNM